MKISLKFSKEFKCISVLRWGKLFPINFALGVVTGITLELQFGTNWSRYSADVGDIFGSLLDIEATALTIVGATFYSAIGLFPNMFPSSIDPAYSLTAFNASSSPLTLKIMLVVALIFVPIVLIYQAWAYHLFKGKISPQDLAAEEAY